MSDMEARIQLERERYMRSTLDKSKCLCGGCMGDAGDETHESLLKRAFEEQVINAVIADMKRNGRIAECLKSIS